MTKFFNFHKSIVRLYQLAAVVILYGVLFCVMAYGFTMAFYTVNKTWSAPFIVTPTTDKILDMTGKVVTSQQAMAALRVDRDKLEISLVEFKVTKAQLDALDTQFQQAISLEAKGNTVDQPELSTLNDRKKQDNSQTEKLAAEVAEVDKTISTDLRSGLITKADAAMARTQIRQTQNATTDSLIGEILLRDTVRQKQPQYSSTVDNLAKEAELKSSIVQLAIQIKSGEEQLASDKVQIGILQTAIDTVQHSPYFLATTDNIKFAFVPYDNQAVAKAGSTVYDCYLNMIACRRVGVVKQVFRDEEHIVHPIFKNDVRGFLVELTLTDSEAAKDKVLFFNKPLLF